MRRRWEAYALGIAAAIAIVFLLGFLFLDDGQPTAPVDRVDEQNTGTDAPEDVVPMPDGGNPTTQQGAPDPGESTAD